MKNEYRLERFGFTTEIGGAHIARTMMFEEISSLLDFVNDSQAEKKDYVKAVEEENCLGKRSAQSRKLTFRHLASLYVLDPSAVLFRALLYFWWRAPLGRPLLTLLCAYSRDAVLRSSAPFILGLSEGETITREDTESFIEKKDPDRFSKATLKSVAQNINGTWTRSGHLSGRIRKKRTHPLASPGAVAYGLLLGHLSGVRGEELFRTDFLKLLDCSMAQAIELAEEASRKGWIIFKRVGDVVEVQFPNLLTAQEMEWIREQN